MKKNMVRIKVVCSVQGGGFGSSETIEEYMWINLDHVITYHEPSCGLVLADHERISVANNEKGHSILVDALNELRIEERE